MGAFAPLASSKKYRIVTRNPRKNTSVQDGTLEHALVQAFSASTAAIMLCSRGHLEHPITFINKAFTDLTGFTFEEVVGRDPGFLRGPQTDATVAAQMDRALALGETASGELINYRKNGEPFWHQLAISPIRDAAGVVTGFLGLGFDTSHLHDLADRSEDEIQLNELVRHLPGFVFRRIMRPDGSIDLGYVGPTLNDILEEPPDRRIDWETFVAHLHPDDRSEWVRTLVGSAAQGSLFRIEYRLVSNSGAIRWFRSEAPARRLADGSTVWDGVALEVTAEKATQAQVVFLESHDRLTGVSNRARFRQALAQAMESLSADEAVIQVMILDVDRFQELNDSSGHAMGDHVLRALGQRLARFVGAQGGCVARIGGDEFAVLLPSGPLAKDGLSGAKTLSRRITRPLRVGDRKISIEASIGVALFPQPNDPRLSAAADGCAELMKQADLALQAAKRDAPGGIRLYTPDLEDRFRHRVALRASLASGLAEKQFELHYQPLVEIGSGDIVGAEALVRWNHPELGLQSPGQFIPIAEASGLIAPLGEWIVNEAFRQGKAWRDAGLGPFRLAINLSSLQLRRSPQRHRPGFISVVEQALEKTGADPRDFEFELTESVLIESSEETVQILRTLERMGFTIAIDDFGTGHSTFRYLRDFPIDRLKIDRSFVSRIGVDLADETIIRAMVGLASSLGIGVIAEGIETEAQRQFLMRLGCTLGQGYLFSMPLKAEDFGWMLGRQMILPAGRATA